MIPVNMVRNAREKVFHAGSSEVFGNLGRTSASVC